MMTQQEIDVKLAYARKPGTDYEESDNLFLDCIADMIYRQVFGK